MNLSTYLWIGVGGFVGANVRYWLTGWAAAHWGVAFPYGTLVINLSGSFLLCFLATLASKGMALPPNVRLAINVGFLGAYTTFSTFSYEWLLLAQDGQGWRSLVYIVASVLGGGLAGGLGFLLASLF
jgi:fluoride exporter